MGIIKDLSDLHIEFKKDIAKQKRNQKIPNFTCPLIDSVQQVIEESCENIDNLIVKLKEHHISGITELRRNKAKLETALKTLEKIREANDQLRDIGKVWYEIASDINEKI